jgi:hypothetical protein
MKRTAFVGKLNAVSKSVRVIGVTSPGFKLKFFSTQSNVESDAGAPPRVAASPVTANTTPVLASA